MAAWSYFQCYVPIANTFTEPKLRHVMPSLSKFQKKYGLASFTMTNHFLGIGESSFSQRSRVNFWAFQTWPRFWASIRKQFTGPSGPRIFLPIKLEGQRGLPKGPSNGLEGNFLFKMSKTVQERTAILEFKECLSGGREDGFQQLRLRRNLSACVVRWINSIFLLDFLSQISRKKGQRFRSTQGQKRVQKAWVVKTS